VIHNIPHPSWLLDTCSLTQKLLKKSHGDFSVELVQQNIRPVLFSEKKALSIPHRQWALVREVILYGKKSPWVYARTVIPLSTLDGSLRRLHYLVNKPLGEQLFTDPTMQREPVEVAQFSPLWLPPKLHIHTPTWGRRSVFRLSNKPLLVSEVFLPALFQ
jgi:chorismate--pyruvate lyase